MRAGRRAATVVALAMAFSAASAQSAFAVFHEVLIREVYPGSATAPESEFVELQMYSPGQHLVSGHGITVHNAAGAQVAAAKFTSNVGSGANQATIVIATTAAEAEFGLVADLTISAGMSPTGGAVCWDGTPDCMSWGSFSGSPESPAGSPAAPAGIPDGQALRRTIAPGCASLLEATDDRDNSVADFEVVFPAPRPNSVAPTEKACGTGGGGPGGGGNKGGGNKGDAAPQTFFRRKPAKRSGDRTPTFRFSSNRSDATFQCKLDKGRYRACRSPFTRKLGFGPHTLRVRARDGGQVDPSPATYGFTILRPDRG